MEATWLNLVLGRMWNKFNTNKRRIQACLLTLIIEELKINVGQHRMVTTPNIIKTHNIIRSVVLHDPKPQQCVVRLN